MRVIIRMCEDCCRCCLVFFMEAPKAGEIDVEHRVAIDRKEVVVEQIQNGQNCPSCPKRRTVIYATNVNPPIFALIAKFHDLLGCVVHQDQDPLNPVLLSEDDLMLKKWLATNVGQRLRQITYPAPEPRPSTTRKYNGLHHRCPSCRTISTTAFRTASAEPSWGRQPSARSFAMS
jgi:hypothetical protein